LEHTCGASAHRAGRDDTIVLAGRTFLFAVTDADARLEHRSRGELAAERAGIIEQAVD